MFRYENRTDKADRHRSEKALLNSMSNCSMQSGDCLLKSSNGTCFYHGKIDYRSADEDDCQSCTCKEEHKHLTRGDRQYHQVDQSTLGNLIHGDLPILPTDKTGPTYTKEMWNVTEKILTYNECFQCRGRKASFFCDCTNHPTTPKPLCTACFNKKDAGGCRKRCMYTTDCREVSLSTDLDGVAICQKHRDMIELTKEEKIVQDFLTDRATTLFDKLDQNTFVWTKKLPSHVFRHKIPFGPGKRNQPRTEITREDMFKCMEKWATHLTTWDLETVRIVVEMMLVAKDPDSELYDIVSEGLLASQTSGTACTGLDCLKARFLCLYADLRTDLNPIWRLLGDSEEASVIQDMPRSSNKECTCAHSDPEKRSRYQKPACTCRIPEATKVVSDKRSIAIQTYIRTHELCRDSS
jgi:hypothetical protein